ncbi:MAG: hypothetical protein COA40_00985 [Aequorivita sp.]|nr:MAG: hypothetical protein COA40_00985 [Aequorivita sp.]
MKLCKLIIKDFQQFKDFHLDLTYPEGHKKEGEPLDKICLIGRNGTGKSTIINFLSRFLTRLDKYRSLPLLIVKIKINDRFIYAISSNKFPKVYYVNEEIDQVPDWIDQFKKPISLQPFSKFIIKDEEILPHLNFKDNSNDLIIYSPSEGQENLSLRVSDVPETQLNDALQLFNTFPYYHMVNTDTIREFWKLLIYLVKKRENDLRDFENQDENQDKTVRKVKEEFEINNPEILVKLSEVWNKILGNAGLEFDFKNANNPIQLNDNLKAYIKLSKTNERINYGQLSTGIRNYIFRVGHIYSLYFNRNIEKGFLLLDEPENSLFPDFLYDLVENYFNLTQNTQLIIATHSPIIAAQFEPYERIILDFNEDGAVYSRKGVTPIGDDPNDLLIKDFGIRSLLGKEGIKKWERYVELKILIAKEKDSELKKSLISEYMEIGNNYNFGE